MDTIFCYIFGKCLQELSHVKTETYSTIYKLKYVQISYKSIENWLKYSNWPIYLIFFHFVYLSISTKYACVVWSKLLHLQFLTFAFSRQRSRSHLKIIKPTKLDLVNYLFFSEHTSYNIWVLDTHCFPNHSPFSLKNAQNV